MLAAATAAEGAPLAAERHPDVILLDLLLPDRSGLELLPSLKAEPATRHIPVVVVSVMNDAVRALTLGAAELPGEAGGARRRWSGSVRRLLDGHRRPGAHGPGGGRRPRHRRADPRHAAREGFRTMVAHDGRQALELIGPQAVPTW